MNSGKQKDAGRLYGDWIRREVARPEVRLEKRQFLDAHFPADRATVLRPVSLIPALALLAVVLVWVSDGMRRPETAAPRPGAPVDVRRVASQAGPVLVYQINHQDVPITVIWVFAGGGP